MFSSVLGQYVPRVSAMACAASFLLFSFVPARAQTLHHYSSGTGFFVSLQGHLVTNAHVIAHCDPATIRLRMPQGEWKLTLLQQNATLDLALLQSSQASGYTPLALRSDDARKAAGTEAAILGYPNTGMNSSIGLPITLPTHIAEVTPTPAGTEQTIWFEPVAERGNSGGPLIDRGGIVLGVVTAKATLKWHQNGASTGTSLAVDMALSAKAVREYLQQQRVYPISRDINTYYPLDILRQRVGESVGNVVCETPEEHAY